jgi:diguanylate cyclase (GGDEF)-like protein/PAS domain S-box-containing protein
LKSHDKKQHRRRTLLGGVALIGVILTGLVALEARQWSDELAAARFKEAAHVRVALIKNELRRQIDQLDSLQRFITQVPDLTAQAFRRMARLNHDYHITIAWLAHVPATELDAYIQKMEAEIGPDFEFSRPGAGDTPPERHFPITFYESTDADAELTGIDPSALPGRMESMTRALASGEAAMVTGIGILTNPDDLSGTLTFAPVFEGDVRSGGGQKRWQKLRGFVGYGLRLSTLLELGNVNPQSGKEDIRFQILSAEGPGEARLLFSQFGADAGSEWLFEDRFTVGGQTLLIRARPTGQYAGAARRPHFWIAGVGVILTVLVIAILRVLLTRNERVEQEVGEKTRALDIALAKERYTSVSLKGVLDAAEQVAIIATQKDGLIRLFNIGAENILGYRASEMIDKKTPLAFHDPDEVERERQRLMEASGQTLEPFDVFTFGCEEPGPAIWTYIRRDGTRRQVRLMVSPIRLREDEIDGWLGVAVDVTDQLAAEQESRRADQMLKALTRNVPGMVYQFRVDADGRMTFPYASDGIYQVYEVSAEEGRESADRAIERIHPDDVAHAMETLEASARSLKRWQADYRVVLPSRGVRWLRGEATPQRAEDGGTMWHGYLADITGLKELEHKLRDEATIDPLTGLHNRRQLEALAQAELEQFQSSGEPFSLIMIDLDHFKAINDRYGHDVGDEVLRRVGALLNESVRTSDIAFRLGGEEMLVLCPATGLKDAIGLAEKLRRLMRDADMPFDDHVTASFGVAAVMRDEVLSDILRRADNMLYRAKREGRNKVVGVEEGQEA